jgi:thioredoxin 2
LAQLPLPAWDQPAEGATGPRFGAAAGTPKCGQCGAPLPWIAEAGDPDFSQVVEASPIPVLVDLWAPWCGPCRVVAPGVEKAAHNFAGKLKVVKVDVDEAPEVAGRYGAQSIPTLLVLHHGREIARQVGAVPPEPLLKWVESVLAKVG